MVYSEQSQALIAYKVQSALGTQSTGSGGKLLRTTGGAGGQLTKAQIESAEVRQDAMSTRGRHGSKKTTGAYETELSVGNMDEIFEAVLQGTYGTANLVVDDVTAAMSSATLSISSNVVTASAGSFITSGFRVGNIIRESEGFVSGNQNRNFRITALTALTMTLAALDGVAIADEAGPIAAYTITRPGRVLINPAAGSLVKRYFTIDEYDILLDQSEAFTDCVWSALALSMAADGMFMANPSWMGTGQRDVLATGASPLLTSPTATTGIPMAAIDATLRNYSGEMIDLTNFDITLDRSPASPSTIRRDGLSPDVFLGANRININWSALRKDLLDLADFDNETQWELSVFLREQSDSAPEDFVSFYFPNFTLGDVSKSALSKDGGPRNHSISVPDALVGKDERGGAYDPTMVQIQVSTAS